MKKTHDPTEDGYQDLKKKLHHAHDKVIKVTLEEETSMREFLEKIVMPSLTDLKIDLNDLTLDKTNYTKPN